jgi:hypothetical protein
VILPGLVWAVDAGAAAQRTNRADARQSAAVRGLEGFIFVAPW